jgi:hypothetical protein
LGFRSKAGRGGKNFKFKEVYYPRNSIGINRRGYSGYGGFSNSAGFLPSAEPLRDPLVSTTLRAAHSAVPLRKINCTLQNALAEKFAVVYCDGYAGLRLKTPPTH